MQLLRYSLGDSLFALKKGRPTEADPTEVISREPTHSAPVLPSPVSAFLQLGEGG